MLNNELIVGDIRSRIHTIRGVQVMIDEDLAVFYKVETGVLNQSVKRNRERFPEKFYFTLTKNEYDGLRSQFVISKKRGGRRYQPSVFTEQGVAMLSGVLKSDIAIQVSIRIMSEFVAMRKLIRENSQLFVRLEQVEQKQLDHSKKFDQIFDALASNEVFPKQKLYFDGEVFDAHVFVSKLIRSAKKEIVLIDNYIDETVLLLLTKRREKVKVTIYSKKVSKELALDLQKHNSQYPEVEIKELGSAHDRFLIVDGKNIYHFGASIKDLGKKWCVVSKLDVDSLELIRRL